MRITLLRHSIAESIKSNDFNRSLTPLGEQKAEHIAQRLKDVGIDAIIASPARRTTQTARYIAKELDLTINFDSSLYNASLATIKQVVFEQTSAQHRLIVGHNPSVSQIATILDRRIFKSFEPCEGATFEESKDGWSMLVYYK